jgi:pimeloyl-ACP methyl ester carboxylesterase
MAFAVVATAGVVCAEPAFPAPAGAGLDRFYRQAISWHGCRTGPDDELGAQLDAGGAQCGEVTVPLDYARPDGRTITVAMSRLPASDPAGGRGALLLNPGGPGELGMPAVGVAEYLPQIAARYDLIGMDPRFVGRSTPITCQGTSGEFLFSAGPDRRTFGQSVARARQVAADCTRDNEWMLPYASTRNTARDMDVIRAALGERKLSYIGWSYGSYLGAVYMQLFPDHVDRFVLDSAVDPAAYGPGLLQAAGSAHAAALENWAGWTAARDDVYHLGTSTSEVLATVDRINQAAAGTPLQVGEFAVDVHVLAYLLFIPVRDDGEASYSSLAADVRVLSDAAGGAVVTPTASLEDGLTRALGTVDQVGDPQGLLTLCADRAVSRSPATYYRDIQAHRVDEPLFGPLTRNITPCAFWPTRPAEFPTRVGNDVPALMVGATGDPRTPYAGQLAMHQALTGSRMVTLQGAFRHIVYTAVDNDCIDDAVDDYLLAGVLPSGDLVCAVEPSGSEATAGTRAS